MKDLCDYPVLLIEGYPPKVEEKIYYEHGNLLAESYIRTNVYNNFMFSRGIDGIIIMHTINIKHTLLTALSLFYYIGHIDKKRGPKPRNAKELITLFPGVGKKKATEILKKYNNIDDLMNNWKDWLPQKGIEKLNSWDWD